MRIQKNSIVTTFVNYKIIMSYKLEALIYTAKMSDIVIALKRIKIKREQNWTVCTDFKSLVKAIES